MQEKQRATGNHQTNGKNHMRTWHMCHRLGDRRRDLFHSSPFPTEYRFVGKFIHNAWSAANDCGSWKLRDFGYSIHYCLRFGDSSFSILANDCRMSSIFIVAPNNIDYHHYPQAIRTHRLPIELNQQFKYRHNGIHSELFYYFFRSGFGDGKGNQRN